MKIAFFDSGVGGLTVMAEARKTFPEADFIYYADTDHVPYGIRPKEDVLRLVQGAVSEIAESGPDAVVIACNTATAVAAEALRKQWSFPVIGMEPAVKPAAACGQQRILVFATALTLSEPKFNRLVDKLNCRERMDVVPMPQLVELAEQQEFGSEAVRQVLEPALAHLDTSATGALVLGCTHYVYFRDVIRRILPGHIQILDGNAGTVRQLSRQTQTLGCPGGSGGIQWFVSGRKVEAEHFRPFWERLTRADT